MRKTVKKYVQECQIFQQQKPSMMHPLGLLQLLALLNQILNEISLDLMKALPKSQGVDTVLVVVDRGSEYGHFLISLKHLFICT